MADKNVKFTEDEMKDIDELQGIYSGLQNSLGQLSISRIRVEQQLDELDSAEEKMRDQFVDAQTKEREFVDSINKKYGDGNLNLSTGVFTPKEKTEEKSDKTL